MSTSESAFSDVSAQDTHQAAFEAQQWIEAVVGKKFPKDSFRESLEDGVLLCELMNRIKPKSIRRINKSKSPIAYLDNIQQFLRKCQELGLRDAQLFDTMDLQEMKLSRRVGMQRNESDRRIRSVCITLYWLGRMVAEMEDYSGPQLDLDLFKKLMEGEMDFSEEEEEEEEEDDGGVFKVESGHAPTQQLNHFQEQSKVASRQHQQHHQQQQEQLIREHPAPHTTAAVEPHVANGDLDTQLTLTFEQEQTADELLADIQNAVEEMLQDFQTSPVAANPPPVAPKTKRKDQSPKRAPAAPSGSWVSEHIVHMRSRNGGFGFQIMGGTDSELPAQVDYIVPGSPADSSGLEIGDKLIHVNGQNVQQFSHNSLVGAIKKAGQAGEVILGISRTPTRRSSTDEVIIVPSSHALSDGDEENLGFSRRESRERWEEDNRERERQAQEIALLYPQRNAGSVPVENGLNNMGPPPAFGSEPLPPLVEHQEEAMFEQIQEMIETAPSPPPSSPPSSPHPPPSSALSSSQTSSHTVSPFTVSLPNQLSDDKETIERELEELTQMEAAKPKSANSELSDSFSEEGVGQDAVDMGRREEEEEDVRATPEEDKMEQSRNDQKVAIRVDSFRVEETSSPLPNSPVTEAVQGKVPQTHAVSSPQEEPLTSPSPEDPVDTLDRELNELLKFESAAAASKLPPPTQPLSSPEEDSKASSDIVTPPPMFDSSPPPKPTAEAPKRVIKRQAPPPPKPKPKAATAEPPKSPAKKQESLEMVNGDKTRTPPMSPNTQEAFEPKPYKTRSDSPDLVSQMQALAYSKSITTSGSSLPESVAKLPQPTSYQPAGSLVASSSPQHQPYRPSNLQPSTNGILQQQQQQQQPHLQSSPQHFPASNGLPGTTSSGNSSASTTTTSTPKIMEVLGDIKIHRVVKTRWTPKGSSSAEPSPAQTPDHQPLGLGLGLSTTPTHQFANRAATLPSNMRHHHHNHLSGRPGQQYPPGRNGESPQHQGVGVPSAVVARGIGSMGQQQQQQQQNRFSQPLPLSTNPYQPQRQGSVPSSTAWRSQEELQGNGPQGGAYPPRSQRMATTPDGSRDFRVQKSMSMPRGSMEDWRAARTNGRDPRQLDGYQVAYSMSASSPYDLCSRCHQPLGEEPVLAVPSIRTQYHRKCFVCRVCRSSLSQGGQSTTVLVKNMQPHCRFCVSSDNGTQTTEC